MVTVTHHQPHSHRSTSLSHLCYPRAWLMGRLCVSGELRGLVGKTSITSGFWEAGDTACALQLT